MIVRPDGELIHCGHATRGGGGFFGFTVLNVEHPGTAPTKVTGRLTSKGVSLDPTRAVRRRVNRFHGEPVVEQ
jgi:hypothetical protein